MKKILETSPYALPGIPREKDISLDDLFVQFANIVIPRYVYVERLHNKSNKNAILRTDLSLGALLKKDNNSGIVYIREMFSYYARKKNPTLYTLSALGRLFNKDHTTIMSNVKRFSYAFEGNEKLPEALRHMKLTVKTDYEEVTKLMNQ